MNKVPPSLVTIAFWIYFVTVSFVGILVATVEVARRGNPLLTGCVCMFLVSGFVLLGLGAARIPRRRF